jgi:hypothetical protein
MIQTGDKVMIIFSGCPCATRHIGKIFIAGPIARTEAKCRECGKVVAEQHCTEVGNGVIPLSWLTKIPPDSEVTERQMEMEA